ncbi:MAG: hypothetical protein JW703_05005 [Candidatus Diapherotrites archaeon]|nr:hypothetical protein [Candidatus Diapherotrites archaeon]
MHNTVNARKERLVKARLFTMSGSNQVKFKSTTMFKLTVKKIFGKTEKPVIVLAGYTGQMAAELKKIHSNTIFSDILEQWAKNAKKNGFKSTVADMVEPPFNPKKIAGYALFEPIIPLLKEEEVKALIQNLIKPENGSIIITKNSFHTLTNTNTLKKFEKELGYETKITSLNPDTLFYIKATHK